MLIALPRQHGATGNEVTAVRHRDGLVRLGHEVLLARLEVSDAALLAREAAQLAPHVLHLLHAYRTGLPWLEAGLASRYPTVVTLTGTDLYPEVVDPARERIVTTVLAAVDAVITQNRLAARALAADRPTLAAKLRYLAPGIALGRAPCPSLRPPGVGPETPLLLHPAGIRPVKANLELLHLFDPLAEEGLPFALAFCGPVLDEAYARCLFAALERRPWAYHAGVISPQAMPAALRQADLVLNHSRSEGLPNALVEAAALGVPVLARDIPGNAAVVEPGVNGLLYEGEESFRREARRLLADPGLRRGLCAPRPEGYDPGRESRELEEIYRGVLERRREQVRGAMG
ncbi:MAG: glycosyltransferase [Thermodesulfobacteriota bacterium]